MAKDDAQKVLADEILNDARKHAKHVLAQAEAETEKVMADAQANSQAEAAKIIGDARSRAERRGGMILRSAEQEIARRKLHAREEVVRQVMTDAAVRVQALPGDLYRRSVVRLSVDAVRQMPSESVVLKVSTSAGDGMDPAALASEIQRMLAVEGGIVLLRVEPAPDLPRGVLAESADGKLRWDNTFEARLKRLKAGLRRTIAPVLFEES